MLAQLKLVWVSQCIQNISNEMIWSILICTNTERITLKINCTKIFESKKMKYLGLIVDSNLNWRNHIFELKKKLNRTISILYKVKHKGFDLTTMRSLYFALFYSYLTYGLNVWCLCKEEDLHKASVLQNNAIRAMSGIPF